MVGLIVAGSITYVSPLLEKLASLQTIPVSEAYDPGCRVGIGLQVEPGFYAQGARVSVIESGPAQRRELLDPIRERVIDLGAASSNTTRDGKDARVVVHFAADQQGRQLTPRREEKVNCGNLEHVKYIENGGVTPPVIRTATSAPAPSTTPTLDSRVATLEAKVQAMIAQATRTDEDKKLAERERAAGATDARATVVAEAQEKTRVDALILKAEERGRDNYIAAAKAAATVSPTIGAAGTRAGGSSEIPPIPWIPVAGGLGILALGLAQFNHQVRRTTVNTIRFTDRAFRRFVLKKATVQLWP